MSTPFAHFFAKINQISPLENNFTEVLSSIVLMPKTLYFRGKIPENVSKNGKQMRPKAVAIVGSRHNTKYGEEIAYRLAFELAKKGVIIISGLAYGIDTISHQGCLDAGGTTIAVLGTPIDDICPKAHIRTAKRIVEQNGAIISEYAPGSTVFAKTSFLERNRIISGLSDAVVVVEAAERSGSLNTATHALAQGKEVFAVPGNITSPYSQGCNKLIKQGAIPLTETDDILRELFPEDYLRRNKRLYQQKLFGDTDVETKIIQSIAGGKRMGEDIAKETHLPPELFNETITILEIKGRVRSLGFNNWALV